MAKGVKKTDKAPETQLMMKPQFYGEALANKSNAGVEYSAPINTQRNFLRTKTKKVILLDSLQNIRALPLPFNASDYMTGRYIDIQDAILMCQKAYYNFSLLKNTVDVMTELSNGKVSLKGGNKKVRDFVGAWFDKIGLFRLKECFFREFFRSSNVFLFRWDGTFTSEDIDRMSQVYGSTIKKNVQVPIRYTLLNPADVKALYNVNFAGLQYYKVLNYQELERIRVPKTDEDKQIRNKLTPAQRQMADRGTAPLIPLEPDKLYTVFYKKQEYEPFSVPMAYAVLDDIDWKIELRRMDRSISRTADWAILLITMGAEKEKGGINQNNIQAMQELFASETVKRVLVADYTTKATWVIPDIASLLSADKYKEVNESIRLGLNILIAGDEKFANSMIKTQLFIQRLKQAQDQFINDFLLPEIKRICLLMGFKNYPTPVFEEFDLKDELQFAKIYTQMLQLGTLTPEQHIEALETGNLPNADELLQGQQDYAKSRKKGLYVPLIGGTDPTQEEGRPVGSKAPQSKKKITPIGGSEEILFDMEKLSKNIILANSITNKVEAVYKTKLGVKKLIKENKDAAFIISKCIFANEEVENWESKIKEYVENPIQIKPEIAEELDSIASEFGITEYLSIILSKSKRVKV